MRAGETVWSGGWFEVWPVRAWGVARAVWLVWRGVAREGWAEQVSAEGALRLFGPFGVRCAGSQKRMTRQRFVGGVSDGCGGQPVPLPSEVHEVGSGDLPGDVLLGLLRHHSALTSPPSSRIE